MSMGIRQWEFACRDLRRQARQLVAVDVQHRQRGELPDLRRHARQLVVVEVQLPQRRELPNLRLSLIHI